MFLFCSARIRIELKWWIRIQVNPDPQPCLRQFYHFKFQHKWSMSARDSNWSEMTDAQSLAF
jgi:hypothetical protein